MVLSGKKSAKEFLEFIYKNLFYYTFSFIGSTCLTSAFHEGQVSHLFLPRNNLQEDIEDISILKGPTASAKYGMRGANGVVLITTKRGSKDEKISIGYDGFLSVGSIRKKMDLLNAEEWLEVVRTGMENTPKYRPGDPAPVFTTNDPNLFDAQGNPLYDTDWQDEATRTAYSNNHQLSIQQGSEKSSIGVFLN